MSFGFGIGDFIAVLELAIKIRKEFAGAPGQFKNISDECVVSDTSADDQKDTGTDSQIYRVRSLSIVLQDVDVSLSSCELSDQQEKRLRDIAGSCKNVLTDLEKTMENYQELEGGGGSLSRRVKRVWKRLKLEPEDVRELRERITSNLTLLNAFQGGMSRYYVVYSSTWDVSLS